jgi:tetratricopeptide (TPR) repeat protein
MKTTGTGVELLSALDRGAYREAIARYESSHRSDDAVETLWRAEVALYLERVGEAREELDRLPAGLDRDLANRAQTIRAELAFVESALDEANEIVAPVIQSTWEAGDHQGHLRATLLRARTELRRGNQVEALERMKEPRRLATVIGNDYYAGIIAHCRAYAYYGLGDYKLCGQALTEALHLLAGENLRWEMIARVLNGAFLADLGRYEESLAECDSGERVALELGLVSQALWARNNAASALSALGRNEEVVDRLKDLLVWERATQHVFAETVGLLSLAMALGELERFGEAERAAHEAIQLARLSNNVHAEIDGEVLLHWAAGRAGSPAAAAGLTRAITAADARGVDFQRCEARLFAADVLRWTQPDVAAEYCRQARGFASVEEHQRLKRLADRIERALAEGPVRFGPNGELIFDLRNGWPDYDTAIETAKRYLVFQAVRQSNGNRSEAARKLGLTRSRFHDIWHVLHGEPSRPRRTGAPGSAAEASLRQEQVEEVDEKPHVG